jgi:putative cell wall-binding protein
VPFVRLAPSSLSPLAALAGLVVAATTLLVAVPAPADAATTSRISGVDRYATAVGISRSGFSPGVPVAFVVTGTNFPDALAAGPAAAHRGGPVLLVERDRLPASTAAELGRLQPGEIVVVGGTSSVSADVARELDRYTSGAVRRLSGTDRASTAAQVSAATFTSASTVLVAGGASFADALAATPAAHRNGAPRRRCSGPARALQRPRPRRRRRRRRSHRAAGG